MTLSLQNLPKELLGYIAGFADDKSLCCLTKTNKLCHEIALRERANRELDATQKELKQIDRLSLTPFQETHVTFKILNCYHKFVKKLIENQALAADQTALQEATKNLSKVLLEELSKAKTLLYPAILENKGSWSQIQSITADVKFQVVQKAYEMMIAACPDQINARSLAVENAALCQQIDIVNSLVRQGAINPLAQKIAVNVSFSLKNYKVFETFLSQGYLVNQDAEYALSQSLLFRVNDLVTLLLENRVMDKTFVGNLVNIPANQGNLEMVKLLLKKGKPTKHELGNAVFYAASKGHVEIVRTLLLKRKINPGRRGAAIKCASSKGHFEIVRDLIASGSITDRNRGKSLEEAAENGHLEIVKLLLASGNFEEQTKGRSVFFALSRCVDSANKANYLPIIKILLDSDPGLGGYNHLCLKQAAQLGDLEIAQSVISKGPVSSEALGVAVKGSVKAGHVEIVKLLLQTGNISPEDKLEAVNIASQSGFLEIRGILEA